MGSVLSAMPDYQLWLLAGVLLAVAEALIPGVYLFWIGAAALFTGLATFLFAPAPALQFGLFALAILLALYGGRRMVGRNPVPSADPLLNDRAARLIGRHVIVSEDIVNGKGRVTVDDGSWTAIGPDLPTGTRVIITAAHGAVLSVELLEEQGQRAG